MPILTYTHGPGTIIRSGIGSDGLDWWLCSFPGQGRAFVRASQIVNNEIFSNN